MRATVASCVCVGVNRRQGLSWGYSGVPGRHGVFGVLEVFVCGGMYDPDGNGVKGMLWWWAMLCIMLLF